MGPGDATASSQVERGATGASILRSKLPVPVGSESGYLMNNKLSACIFFLIGDDIQRTGLRTLNLVGKRNEAV